MGSDTHKFTQPHTRAVDFGNFWRPGTRPIFRAGPGYPHDSQNKLLKMTLTQKDIRGHTVGNCASQLT